MAKAVERRKGTATEHASFTGNDAELTVNTTNKSVHVHDGATAGGFELARTDLSNTDLTATITELNYVDGVTSAIQTQLNSKANLSGANFTGNVDVTGTVTADGLTVDGNGEFNGNAISLDFMEADQTDKNLRLRANGGVFSVQTLSDNKSTQKNRFQISHTTGDVSFFEDTGTTAKMVWSSSDENLTISGANNYTAIVAENALKFDRAGANYVMATNASGWLEFFTGNSRAMVVKADGNVGIGTASPALAGGGTGLHLNATSYPELKLTNSTTGTGAGDGSLIQGNGSDLGIINRESGNIEFQTSNTERARLDSSGNLLVGFTSDFGTKGTGLFNDGVAVKTSKAVTETICTGASGTFSTITISFEGNNDNSTGIMDVQVAGYNDKGLDYCAMQYSTGAVVQMRSNASSGLSVSFAGTPNSTSGVWTMTISGSITHPVVTAKCTVGGLATGFSVAPTISIT